MDRVVFHVSPLGILAALAFAVCASPVALAAPALAVIFLVPIGIIVWVLRTRTSVDGEAITVRQIVSSRRVPWAGVTSLRLQPASRLRASRVSAMLADGGELPLPAVHVRDLSKLATASGGRLPDPSAAAESADDEPSAAHEPSVHAPVADAPDPATPDPATPDPATPDPATPDPATPDPATPDPAPAEE